MAINKEMKKPVKKSRGPVKKGSQKAEKEKIKENRIIRNVLIFIGIFFLMLILSFVIMKNSKNPKYGGLTFNIINEGELTFYHTSIPIIYKGEVAYYNIYLRNNPRELKRKVPFYGELDSIKNTVINITDEFDCEGDQVIAIANLVNIYGAIGKEIMKDENASCDELGRYTYLIVQQGEETSIEKFGTSCYKININDCEILEGTERFIAEMLAKYHSEVYE